MAAGDIAFVCFNADGDDDFGIVVLKEICASVAEPDTIYFTDNEWDGASFNTGEGEAEWVITSKISAGTIVAFTDTDASGTISVDVGSVSGRIPISGTDEVIYAFLGSPSMPTTFLAAIANDDFTTTTGSLTNTGLTAGTNAIDLGTEDRDADIGEYIGARTGQNPFTAFLDDINDATNWITQDDTGDQSGDETAPDLPCNMTVFESCPDLSSITPTTFDITESTCSIFGGNPSGGVVDTTGNNCPAGTSLQFAIQGGSSFSSTLPSYDQNTSITLLATCICGNDNTYRSDTVSVVTAPGLCPECPDLSLVELPIEFSITESTCSDFGLTFSGGIIDTTGNTCPTGSTIHFSLEDGPFTDTLPDYRQADTVKVEATCICDADNTMTSDTSEVTTMPGECPMTLTYSLNDPCNCNNSQNCEFGSNFYFHDILTLPSSGSIASGLDIRVNSSSDFFIDVPCNAGLLEPSYGMMGTSLNEIGTSGVYEIEFWREPGAIPSLSLLIGGNVFNVPSTTFEPACNVTMCASEPIPTMGDWGLIILSLFLSTLGALSILKKQSKAKLN